MHFIVGGKKFTAKGNNIVDSAGNVVGAIEGKQAANDPYAPELVFNVKGKRYGVVMKQKAEKAKGNPDVGESGTIFPLPVRPRQKPELN